MGFAAAFSYNMFWKENSDFETHFVRLCECGFYFIFTPYYFANKFYAFYAAFGWPK